MKFLPKLYHTIRSYFTSKVELLQLTKSQLEVTDINFRPIHEDNQSFLNDLKIKFKIFNLGADFIYNFMSNPKMKFILISEVIRSKPMLKRNKIFNQALLKDKKEEIDIHNRARTTISSLLVKLNCFSSLGYTIKAFIFVYLKIPA